jgi:tRNA/tmRNA/rRNA uracil-C5-methylase (TrmA/RlmC/RlmD family)
MNSIKKSLTKIVKEKGITDIIIENKEDMELVHHKKLYREWVNEERSLSKQLSQAKSNIQELKRRIKNKCKHADVTEIITPGWERSVHSYMCNDCKFYVHIHDEFDYKNITKTIDY